MPKAPFQDFAFHVFVVMCFSVDAAPKILPKSITNQIAIPSFKQPFISPTIGITHERSDVIIARADLYETFANSKNGEKERT